MTGPYVTEGGGRTADELFGEGGRAYMERQAEELARKVDESWAHIHNDYVMNGMYSRGVLSTAVRELCAVAALTVLSHAEELEPHIRFALRSNPPEHVLHRKPVEFEVLRWTEWKIHKHLSRWHVRGEWFRVRPVAEREYGAGSGADGFDAGWEELACP